MPGVMEGLHLPAPGVCAEGIPRGMDATERATWRQLARAVRSSCSLGNQKFLQYPGLIPLLQTPETQVVLRVSTGRMCLPKRMGFSLGMTHSCFRHHFKAPFALPGALFC